MIPFEAEYIKILYWMRNNAEWKEEGLFFPIFDVLIKILFPMV